MKFSLRDQQGKSRADILEKYRGIAYHRSGCQSERRIRFIPPAVIQTTPTNGHLSTTAPCFGGNIIGDELLLNFGAKFQR